MMDKAELEAKKSALEEQYKKLEADKGIVTKQLQDIAAEQLRLDGEYRLVTEMLKEPEAPVEEPKEPVVVEDSK